MTQEEKKSYILQEWNTASGKKIENMLFAFYKTSEYYKRNNHLNRREKVAETRDLFETLVDNDSPQ